MAEENQGRECPSCGRITARGEVECEQCGTLLALDPAFISPRQMLWGGRAAAVAALLAPAAAVVALMLAGGLASMHARDRDAVLLAFTGIVLALIGYVSRGGFVLI